MNAIEKELQHHREMLNTELREQYAHELELDHEDESIDVAQAVLDCDYESMDFNIGFEQGYMRGLEVALSLIK